MVARLPGPTAGILIIGEEILSGKVEDENARHLVHELRALGVSVRRIEVIPDDLEDIAVTVKALSARFDYVFTSGGIGPTHDDLTLLAIANAFDMQLARRPELEDLIRKTMGPEFNPRDLRMADVPDGARLLYGVPAEPSRWPVIAVRNVFVLPGVPAIFRRKFDSVRELFRAGPIHSQALYSSEGEGLIAGALDALVAEFPTVAIGSYPRLDATDHKVKVTLDGRDADAVERAAARLAEQLGVALVRVDKIARTDRTE
jgi:molybdenum cofactor synthesis domain-containing protein